MTNFLPPKIDYKYCIIVNNDDNHLAALISSYLSEQESYLPLFAFPKVEVFSYQEIEDIYSYEYRSKSKSQELSIWISNALAILKDCKTVVLGGLSEYQKSFIKVEEEINCIEIDSISDIDLLKSMCLKSEYLECKSEDIYMGLISALKADQYLVINEYAESIKNSEHTNEKGVIVIENLNNVSAIVAINYAFSINALPVIINSPNISMNEVNAYISDWQDTKNEMVLNDLRSSVYPSIEQIHFENFEFTTFFTIGIPYSLVIENIIPCTHVNLILRLGFYVLNTIFAETRVQTFGSVVFSTQKFKDEETQDLIDTLNANSFHVKEILGREASCANLDYHVKEFPFDLFHICAHGGEVKGTQMSAEIIDENGKSHTYEYDNVLSFAPYPGMDKIGVTSLYFPRKLDGLTWKSKELNDKKFTAEFYESISKQLSNDKGKKVGDQITVHNSFGINCHDFVYTGQFNTIAGFNSYPVIYNNSCWSWGEISKSFLNSGARMYIGNLWKINNDTAIEIAEKFYELIFDHTILEAFYGAIQKFKGTSDYFISMMWGLHFSTLKKGSTIEASKNNVVVNLCKSYSRWHTHKQTVSNPKTHEKIDYQIQWIEDQLTRYYKKEVAELKQRLKEK